MRMAGRVAALSIVVVLGLGLGLAVLAGCSTAAPPIGPIGDQTQNPLVKGVSGAEAFPHLEALQRIADTDGGTRAAPGPGYDASVDYVAGVLRAAGYDVSTPTYVVSSEHGPSVTLRSVVAQTRTGGTGRVVMAGAHLDSVAAGPGINDDGSGVAALLAIATRLGGSPPVSNAVRFAFWGSEEDDLQGSTQYVDGLTGEQRDGILLYLNLDMLASPNAGYFVQGRDGGRPSRSGPPGSGSAGHVLTEQLAATGVAAQTVPFTGDDETAFVEAGIPTAGAKTGDADTKNPQQAQAWGGTAAEVFDPCYHRACDGLQNIDRVALDRYTRAAAATIAFFSTSDRSLRP
jgi:aminopeptidase S